MLAGFAHAMIPFFPARCLPQDSMTRKYEPERSRRTSDGGAPRTRLEHDGVVIPSLNEVINTHGFDNSDKSLRLWSKEVKSRIGEKSRDDSIMLYAAWHVFD